MKISLIIPALNEAGNIGRLLSTLQPLRQRGHEVIVVDGESVDDTVNIVTPLCDHCLTSQPGRARQMRVGAQAACGDVLWFLHADSTIPVHADELIFRALTHSDWGGFPVRLSGHQALLRIVERLMNLRSGLTGILTGDQGIFIRRSLYDLVGGFRALPLMEDIDLSTRLRQVMRPAFADSLLGTSSRRWETRGTVRTIIRMWILRLAFYVGVPARYLANYYV